MFFCDILPRRFHVCVAAFSRKEYDGVGSRNFLSWTRATKTED